MKPSVEITGLWLRASGDRAIVSAEINGKWHDVISERMDGPFSHIAEPSSIETSPISTVEASDVV